MKNNDEPKSPMYVINNNFNINNLNIAMPPESPEAKNNQQFQTLNSDSTLTKHGSTKFPDIVKSDQQQHSTIVVNKNV